MGFYVPRSIPCCLHIQSNVHCVWHCKTQFKKMRVDTIIGPIQEVGRYANPVILQTPGNKFLEPWRRHPAFNQHHGHDVFPAMRIRVELSGLCIRFQGIQERSKFYPIFALDFWKVFQSCQYGLGDFLLSAKLSFKTTQSSNVISFFSNANSPMTRVLTSGANFLARTFILYAQGIGWMWTIS